MCNQDGVFSTTMRCIGIYLEVVCGLKRHKKYALMIILVLSQKVLAVTPGVAQNPNNKMINYYSLPKCKRIYGDFFVSQNVPTDVEHVEPALAYVGALNSIGVVMTLSINGRIVESVNMKVSSKIDEN